MNFQDKIILITGASRGIGKYAARKLSDLGAKVIGIYNDTIISFDIDAFKCDLGNEEEIKKLFKYIKDKYGVLDYVINCAAISKDNDIVDKTKEEFMKVLEINLVGTFLICKYALEMMEKGAIINMSSTNASTTYNILSMDYDASKAGIENLTKNLAERYPDIKICALAPNWVDTESVIEMDPEYLQNELKRVNQKRLLTKAEVANKIIEIISSDDINSGEIIRMEDYNE